MGSSSFPRWVAPYAHGDAGGGRDPVKRKRLVAVAGLALVISACGGTGSAPETQPTSAGLAVVSDGPALDVQGHRGARGLRPENTLPSFETALDLGVTTLELDLHFTSDGQVVIWHDPGIDRVKCRLASGAPDGLPDPDDVLVVPEDLMVRALTAEQLGWYQCDRNPDRSRFPDQTSDATTLAASDHSIVTLGALFDFVATYGESDSKTEAQRATATSVRFNIETKRRADEPQTIGDEFDGINAGPFELEILRVVAEYDLEDRVVIQSFDHRSLWAVRAADPSIALAGLTVGPTDLDDLASGGASIWSPSQRTVTQARVLEAHDVGLLVIPWTVNESSDMKRLIAMGVDGLITDRPDILVLLLSVE